MRKRIQLGFSLLEMMAVVAILLILSAVAAPSLLRAIKRYQLESATRQVGGIVIQARYEAMRNNRRIATVYRAPAGNVGAQFGIDFGGTGAPATDGNGVLDPGEPRAQLPVGLEIYPFTFGPYWVKSPDYTNTMLGTTITFAPDGTVVRQVGGVWQIVSNVPAVYMYSAPIFGDYYVVTVTPAGRTRLWKYGLTTPVGWQSMQ